MVGKIGPTQASLTETISAELAEAGRLNTGLGLAALALAQRIESGRGTDSAAASLTRELRVTLEAATAGARVAASPLAQMRDELAERRRRSG